jgi:hypothetical protein
MPTDTESTEQDKSLDSSRAPNRRANSDRLATGSRKTGPVADATAEAEPKLTSLDLSLSLLQSDLGEIRDRGVSVRFFDDPNGLLIQLPNVRICRIHLMIHSGTTCPIC